MASPSQSPQRSPEAASDPVKPAPKADDLSRRKAGPLALTLSGLAAGLLAAAFVQAAFPLFEVPDELLPSGLPSPEVLAKADAAQFRADRLNGACAGAIFGVLAGLFLGFAAAARRESAGRMLVTSVATALAGGAAGGLGGYLMLSLRSLLGPATVDTELWQTVAVQAFLLGLIGVAIGAALSLMQIAGGAISGRLLGGLAGGVLAGTLYPVVTALLFPHGNTEGTVPEDAAVQFLWLGAAGLLIGLCIGGLQRCGTRRVGPPTTSAEPVYGSACEREA